MKKLIICLILVIISAPTYGQVSKKKLLLNYPNSCLVNSVLFYEEINNKFKSKNIWSEVLGIVYLENENGRTVQQGHAVCIFEWKGKFFMYDINNGSGLVEMNGVKFNMKKDALKMAEWIYGEGNVLAAEYLAN
jgi:hypothetical protein